MAGTIGSIFLICLSMIAIMATSISGKVYKNKATGLCLDSNENGRAYTMPCNDENYQEWKLRPGGRIVNVSTGKCLDSNPKGKLYTMECNDGSFQRWERHGHNLRNRATGKCLESNTDMKAYTRRCYGGSWSYQNWS